MTHCWRAAPFGTARCVRASKSAAERRKAEGCIRMSPPVTLLHLGVHKRADESLIKLFAKIIFLHAIKYILHYRIFSYFYVIFIGKFLFLRFSLPKLLLSESQSSGRVSRVLNWPALAILQNYVHILKLGTVRRCIIYTKPKPCTLYTYGDNQ